MLTSNEIWSEVLWSQANVDVQWLGVIGVIDET